MYFCGQIADLFFHGRYEQDIYMQPVKLFMSTINA